MCIVFVNIKLIAILVSRISFSMKLNAMRIANENNTNEIIFIKTRMIIYFGCVFSLPSRIVMCAMACRIYRIGHVSLLTERRKNHFFQRLINYYYTIVAVVHIVHPHRHTHRVVYSDNVGISTRMIGAITLFKGLCRFCAAPYNSL